MRETDHDKLDYLRMANPIREDSVAGWARGSAGRRLLEKTMASTLDRHISGRSTRWRAGRVTFALGVSLAVAAVLALQLGSPGQTQRVPVTSGEVTTLESLAQIASAQPLSIGGEGEVHYTAAKIMNAQFTAGSSPYTVLFHSEREVWIQPDGSGLTRTRLVSSEFPSSADRQAWEASGSPAFDVGRIEERSYVPGELHQYQEYVGLSTDVEQLYEQIKDRAGDSGPGVEPEMFIVIGDLLRAANLPPDMRASLFRVAARIPGVRVTDGATDPDGRTGIAASLVYDDQNGSLMELRRVFDKETTELMSETQTVVGKTVFERRPRPPGAPPAVHAPLDPPTLRTPPGTLVSSTVYLKNEMVDTVGGPGRT